MPNNTINFEIVPMSQHDSSSSDDDDFTRGDDKKNTIIHETPNMTTYSTTTSSTSTSTTTTTNNDVNSVDKKKAKSRSKKQDTKKDNKDEKGEKSEKSEKCEKDEKSEKDEKDVEDDLEKPTTGLKRKPGDKYYTAPHVVNKCIELLKEHVPINRGDICIEPSAGDGAFIESLKNLFERHNFYDIEPRHNEVSKLNYLEYEYVKGDYKDIVSEMDEDVDIGKIHVIGNPPFGRQGSLAVKFIKHSCKFCDTFSFILPKSFRKISMQRHIDLHFHLICDVELEPFSFLVDGVHYDVPCIFQIWEKREEERYMPKKAMEIGYKFVKRDEPHDISFRRVGGKAGEICTEYTTTKSIQSHYFIKFDDRIQLSDELINILRSMDYSCKEDTTGPKSISKQEIIYRFNDLIGDIMEEIAAAERLENIAMQLEYAAKQFEEATRQMKEAQLEQEKLQQK